MIRRRFHEFATAFELKTTGKWFLLSSLIGCAAGFGAIPISAIDRNRR